MKLTSRLIAIAFTALALAGCASEAPPPAPLPVAYVPPAAPPPPPVALSRSVIEAASAYRSYMRRAAEITPAFADGQSVEQALMSGVAYEQRQLLRGAIAYGALVALQNPQFVAGVRTYAVDPNGRRALAQRLLSDPNYAAALPSAAGAAGMISAALNSDAAGVRRAGELVKQSAYDVQRQSWSLVEVAGRDSRLANAKALSSQMTAPPPEDVQRLSATVTGSDSAGALGLVGADAMTPPYTAVISRSLTLAALAALGEAGEANDGALQSLLDENAGAFCLNMGKLNTYQCLSVAKPYYEDVFCLGQHILLDTAQCIAKASGAPQPIAVAIQAPPPAPPAPVTRRAPVRAKPKAR